MKHKIKLLACCFCMLVLILDNRLAMKAATDGIEICLRAVIPSLFPFFFISGLLTEALNEINLPYTSQIGRFLKIAPNAVPLWLIGILGGYPVGAQIIGQAVENGNIHPSDGRKMLAFCNNCGPAFIIGIISRAFDHPWVSYAIWAIHILSSILCGWIIPGKPSPVHKYKSKSNRIPDILKRSTINMAQICGWIVMFRVLLSFLERWFGFLMNNEVLVAFSGFLELSNGCFILNTIADIPTRFILCSAMVGFGGICVTMQTLSVCQTSLKTDLYIPGKILQCGISILLSGILMACIYHQVSVILFMFGILFTVLPTIFLYYNQKRGRFFRMVSI